MPVNNNAGNNNAGNNDAGNNDAGNNDAGNNDTSKQNPVRLTIGNYYCSNCGENNLSRREPQCPRCQDNLQWDSVDI